MPTIDRTIGAYHDSSSSRLRKIGGITGPASYVSGGDPITAGDLGMGRIEVIFFTAASNGTLFRVLVFVPGATPGTALIKWVDATNGTEVAAGANLSAYTARFEAIGQ